jgi:chaperonin GroES
MGIEKELIAMALKPLKDRVVAVVEKPLEKTKSGILLGEAKEKPAYAVVESVGPEVKEIKKGDKIVYKEYSTTEIKIDEKDYIILKEEDVLATL